MNNYSLSLILCGLFLGSALADILGKNITLLPPRDTGEWAFELKEGANAIKIADKHGHDLVGAIGHLPNVFVVKQRKHTVHGVTHPHHSESDEIVWAEKQYARQLFAREPTDPLYGDQWHLHTSRGVNYNVNIVGAWNQGLTGAGVRIAVVDDGYEYTHPDLSANYASDSSYDFNYNDADPYPDSSADNHGTSAAGAAGARDNGVCGVGSAYRASMAGIRLISAGTTDSQEAAALGYKWDKNHIYTNSWGPVDDGRRLEGPGRLATTTIEQATISGRNGRGSIYIWAGGNGRSSGDNCNYDGWANSRFTISIGAIDSNGNQAWYSESCSMLVGVAPSSGGNYGVTTADLSGSRGFTSGDCRNNFGGTSAAAPIAAGVAALVLQKNPELGWRDVQGVLIRSCKQHRSTDTDWVVNGAGLPVSHKYGFGLLDATKAVNLAGSWQNLGVQVSRSITNSTQVSIPGNGQKYTSTIVVDDSFNIEHVMIKFVATHPRRGELAISLKSPAGTVSRLQEGHSDTNANIDWTYGSIMQWGENSRGKWTLEVLDTKNGGAGKVISWSLMLYGH